MPTKRKSMPEVHETVSHARVESKETPVGTAVRTVFENFGTVLLIAAAFLIGMLWTEVRYLKKGVTTTAATTATTPTTQAAAQPAGGPTITKDQISSFLSGDYIHFGKSDSKLVFVEVSDPSCPYCHVAGGEDASLNKSMGAQFTMAADGGTYVPPVKEMRKLVDAGKAAFIWLYYPGHGNGELGTLALYCANEKGKFWEAHDLLMSDAGYTLMNTTVKNDRAKTGDVANFLKSVVNPADMKNCLDGGKYNARLTGDMALAQKLNIGGTPLFFVNTTAFAGAYSYTDMQAATQTTL